MPRAVDGTRRFPGGALAAKIFFTMTLVFVVVLGGALLITKQRADHAADESIDQALGATQAAIEAVLTGRSDALLKVTVALAQVPSYVSRIEEALRMGNRSNLLDQADEFRDQIGAVWTLITDDRGVLKAWTYRPDLFDEDFSTGSLIGLALDGAITEGTWIEPTTDGDLVYQAVGIPIFDPSRTTIYGVLVAAQPLDSLFAAELKQHTTSEVLFFALDPSGSAYHVVSTVPEWDVDSSLASQDVLTILERGTGAPYIQLPAAEGTLVGVVGPLLTAAGFPLGGYVGLRSRERELAAYTELQRTILIAFAASLVLTLLSALFVARQITRPLNRLVQATRQVSEGHYSGEIDVRSRDEIGELATAFQRMLRSLHEKEHLIEYLSSSAGGIEQLNVAGGTPRATSGVIATGSILSGRYEIHEMLGSGGMGEVYRAYDRELSEIIAIKTLKPEALQGDDSVLQRFKQEIRLARRITHRNVVRTHDIGEVGGTYYISMEYVKGTTLKGLIAERGTLPVRVAVAVGKQLCQALEAAHQQGVIHRDIKPQNLVVDPSGFLKVTDFGIARLKERSRDGANDDITATGATVGTPEYMAPEQLMGEEIDERADLFAVGAVLFECVTGRPMFDAPTVAAVMMQHVQGNLESPRSFNPEVPESLASIILRALAERREDRWESARELRLALESISPESQ